MVMAPSAFVCLAATLLLQGSAETCSQDGGTCSSPHESASLLQTVVKTEGPKDTYTYTSNSKASQTPSALKTSDLSGTSGVATLRDDSDSADPNPQVITQCSACTGPDAVEDQVDCLMDNLATNRECPKEQDLRDICASFKTCVQNFHDLEEERMIIAAGAVGYSSSRRRSLNCLDSTKSSTATSSKTATTIKRLLEEDAEVAATAEEDCVNPSTDSPLTTDWGCKDCLANAIADCQAEHPDDFAEQGNCLQEKACESTKITCSWKQSAGCDADQYSTGNCCERSNQMDLMERSNQSSGRDELDKLDDSMQDKCGGTDSR